MSTPKTQGKCFRCGNTDIHHFSCGFNIARPEGCSPVLESEKHRIRYTLKVWFHCLIKSHRFASIKPNIKSELEKTIYFCYTCREKRLSNYL
jgi:hypothetical protein